MTKETVLCPLPHESVESSIPEASDFTSSCPYQSCFEGAVADLSTIPLATLQRVRPKLPFHTPICLCPGKFIGGPSTFSLYSSTCRRPLRSYRNRPVSTSVRPKKCSSRIRRENRYGKREPLHETYANEKRESLARIHRDPLYFFFSFPLFPSSLYAEIFSCDSGNGRNPDIFHRI